MLKKYGVPPHFLGYKYLGDAIEIIREDSSALYAITKVLYPTIAKKNKTTASRVERAMRYAVEYAYSRLKEKEIKEAFGNTLIAGEKPTNTHFIAIMVEELKEQE